MDPSLPYTIGQSDTLGRYMIANKDLKLGEIIFKEYPIATGLIVPDPDYDCTRICIECYSETEAICAGCGFPICESHDPLLPKQHTSSECDLLTKCQNYASPEDAQFCALISSQLFFVRCLQLSPEQMDNFKTLETNYEKWRSSKLYHEFKQQLKLLQCLFGHALEFPSATELCLTKARQDINSYEIKLPNCGIQAVYALASMLEHNCIPNTHRSTTSSDLNLVIRAAHDISKGTHLSMSYSDLFWTTAQRQKELKATKFFACSCLRCTDPTECGTLLSALMCPKCLDDPLIPALGTEVGFVCTNCNNTVQCEEIRMSLRKAKRELSNLEISCDEEEDTNIVIENFMEWLWKWTNRKFVSKFKPNIKNQSKCDNALKYLKMHPQNTLVVDVCHTIFLLISLTNENISEDAMKLKIGMGQHLLKTMTPITPGISRFRSTVMHDLAHTRALLDTRNPEFLSAQQTSLDMWKEALDVLQYEPADSPEGALYKHGISVFQKYALCLRN